MDGRYFLMPQTVVVALKILTCVNPSGVQNMTIRHIVTLKLSFDDDANKKSL